MPSYKLLYFNARGRAETSRMLFALADVEFVDERFTTEDWPKVKSTIPFLGQVPLLYVDDTAIAQSHAIERFLARTFGYAGKSDIEQALVDMLVDTVEDITSEGQKYFFMEDPEKKAELKEKFNSEVLPRMLGILEKFLSSNNGGDGFFVGDSITFADIAIANLMHDLKLPGHGFTYDIKGNHPKLAAMADRVFNEPKIAAWIAKRPDSPF